MDTRNDGLKERYRVPATAISVDEDVAVVKVEMPGVEKEGLEIRIDGNELAVSGARNHTGFEGEYVIRERGTEPYRKMLILDDSIDRNRDEAKLEDGVLTLRLHVKEAAKPRRIEIA
jgi:HSP20 family protein